MAAEVARDKKGLWLAGQSGNPKGGAAHAIARRRIGKAVDRRIKVACAEEIAAGLVAGMLDPDGLPVAARIAFDRVWPTKQAVEVSGPGGGPLEVLSVDERTRLADLLGEEIPEGTLLTAEDPDGSATP